MNEGVVLQTAVRREAMEAQLVLEAAAISNELSFVEGRWRLMVAMDDASRASAELAAYQQEKRETATEGESRFQRLPGAELGVLCYASVIMLLGFLSASSAFGKDWYVAGEMVAARVVAGEYQRCFTALTLHADSGHIASNLLFGSLFGYFAGQALGGGGAWLVILLGGALGNAMNAWVQPAQHVSIGASTAVFSALGVMVVFAFRPAVAKQPDGSSQRNTQADQEASDIIGHFKRWSPLVGGVSLLALLGVGDERTDVIAHVTGFFAGLIVGWLGCRLPRKWLRSRKFQSLMGVVCCLLLALAWIVALSG